MAEPEFFPVPAGLSVSEVAARVGGTLTRGEPSRLVTGVAPLDAADASDITFIDNPKYLNLLAETRAGTVICAAKFAARVPEACAVIEAAAPYRAFATVVGLLYPDALRPPGIVGGVGISPAAHIDPAARLEAGAVVVAAAGGGQVGPHPVDVGLRGSRVGEARLDLGLERLEARPDPDPQRLARRPARVVEPAGEEVLGGVDVTGVGHGNSLSGTADIFRDRPG